MDEIKAKLDRLGIWADNPDTEERILFALGLLETTSDNWANAGIALEYISRRVVAQDYPTTAYIYALTQYGLGHRRLPDPVAYGLLKV